MSPKARLGRDKGERESTNTESISVSIQGVGRDHVT